MTLTGLQKLNHTTSQGSRALMRLKPVMNRQRLSSSASVFQSDSDHQTIPDLRKASATRGIGSPAKRRPIRIPSDEAFRPISARNFIPAPYCRGTKSQTMRNERSGRVEQG